MTEHAIAKRLSRAKQRLLAAYLAQADQAPEGIQP
jgi:hypothetical protein